MKTFVSLGAVVFSIGLAALTSLARSGRPDSGRPHDLEDSLIGAWRLASLEEPDVSGEVHKADCTGMLVFTRDGHLSVQVMYREPPSGHEATPYAPGGYEASFGSYKVEKSAGRFTFHVEGSIVRSLVGKDLPRTFELGAGRLTVRSTDLTERWRAVWER